MKIAIIGFSGSGKSTLAKRLSKKLNAELLYLDTVHWLPGWIERDDKEKEGILETFLNEHDNWVIDGNYKRILFDRRMKEADMIVCLRFNRFACLTRVVKRYIQNKGKSRDSITEGCEERLNVQFLSWVLFKGRTRKKKKFFDEIAKQYPDKITVIRNQKQLDNFEKNWDREGLK